MSTQTTTTGGAPPEERTRGFQPEPGVGIPIAVGTFGFSVLMLGIANSGLITGDAADVFAAVAFGTGAFGLLIGGLMELRANNIFGGSFALFYSAFLLTTALMLRFHAVEMDPAAFAAAFGTWLLLWCVFTFMLSWAAWYINMPAFLAFVLLAVGYLCFGLANFVGPPAAQALSTVGGWVLIVDGLVAWYLSWGLAVNPVVGGKVPLWPHPYARSPALARR
jgi:succinate-acetate transporter protein